VKDYDLFGRTSAVASDGFVTVNGYIYNATGIDFDIEVVPYGTEYPAPLITVSPPDQTPGLTSGTFQPITPNALVTGRTATSLTGNGSGATFSYLADNDGNLFRIFASSAGTGYLEGDHLSITTTAAHGSQTLSFRLVPRSNEAKVGMTFVHDQKGPLPFQVREYKNTTTNARQVFFLRERS
jgi:hypothetical protein